MHSSPRVRSPDKYLKGDSRTTSALIGASSVEPPAENVTAPELSAVQLKQTEGTAAETASTNIRAGHG